MKILETLVLAGVVTISHFAFEVWSNKQPLSFATNFSFGTDKNAQPAAPLKKSKIGYIGLILTNNVVGQVFPGSPADNAGITPGDKIMDINEKSIFGLDGNGIVDHIRGPEGSIVELIIEHGDNLRKLKLALAAPVAPEAQQVVSEMKVTPLVE